MLRGVSVSAVVMLLGGCGGPPPGNPALFNQPDARLARERAATVYPADQGGQCSEFRVVGVDGVEKRRMTPGAFQLAPGPHELVFHKDGNAGTVPDGGVPADVFLLELLSMGLTRPVCTAISRDMCLRFDATLEPGRSYRVRVDGEDTYRLVDWQSGQPVARGEIVARRQTGGKPLNCSAMLAGPGSGPTLPPLVYGPAATTPVPGAGTTGRIVPAVAPRQQPATSGPRSLIPADGPKQLLPGW